MEIFVFEFHQDVIQHTSREDMCRRFQLKMKCDKCRRRDEEEEGCQTQ